ncbi:hypothetical protein CEXT_480011 [Caerostris extrusa]|uniref:Maturase K n=1 Tax=Caerostris extrusa TaxID=172846 RepID=A0AAV4RSX5_CAEEX|nr:hypothetical protein CEXT_480011 [Caerostris extrusa]
MKEESLNSNLLPSSETLEVRFDYLYIYYKSLLKIEGFAAKMSMYLADRKKSFIQRNMCFQARVLNEIQLVLEFYTKRSFKRYSFNTRKKIPPGTSNHQVFAKSSRRDILE